MYFVQSAICLILLLFLGALAPMLLPINSVLGITALLPDGEAEDRMVKSLVHSHSGSRGSARI